MFPYIEAKGTHRQIGRAIGESLRQEISHALTTHFQRLHRRRKKHHPKAVAVLTKTAKRYFPDFIEEVEGIAEGSGQPLEQLLMFSFEEELAPGEHCTTLAVKNHKTIYFAHNEDWDLGLPLYIIKAKPNKKPEFLSVGQAGQFPGAIGFNERGLVFSNNSISTKINFNGLPKVYCLRKFLECESIDDAISSITRHDRAIGNNSVMVSAREKRITTLEWSPHDFVLEEIDHGLAHTNHFLSEKMRGHQIYKTSTGSYRRFLHAQEKVLSSSDPKLADIKKIMRTHIIGKTGICQHASKKNSYQTLTSVIIDTSAQKMLVTAGNPCKHRYQTFSL